MLKRLIRRFVLWFLDWAEITAKDTLAEDLDRRIAQLRGSEHDIGNNDTWTGPDQEELLDGIRPPL